MSRGTGYEGRPNYVPPNRRYSQRAQGRGKDTDSIRLRTGLREYKKS